MNITKMDLCQRISKKMENPVTDVKPIIEAFLSEVVTALAEDNRIEIRGFGSFRVKTRKTRIGRNPRTGAPVPIPEYKAMSFKFSRDAQESFETELGNNHQHR